MGWQGEVSTTDRIFGNVVDTVIRQAACEVVLVKWSEKILKKRKGQNSSIKEEEKIIEESLLSDHQCPIPDDPCPTPHAPCPLPNSDLNLQELGLHTFSSLHRWLVPIRGGYQQAAALRLLPALTSLSNRPEINLCQVHQPTTDEPDHQDLNRAATFLKRKTHCSVASTLVCAKSVPEALIDLAQKDQCDVIVLGASREGLLKQVIQGNIPEAVARGCDCTVILVRAAT